MRRAAIMWEVVRDVSTEFDVRPPFTADEFCRALERAVDRPIVMQPRTMRGTTVYGACRALPDMFVVHYRADGSLVHQERIKYHELGHILFGHVTAAMDADLERSCHDLTPAQERDAETFAEAITLYALLGDRGPMSETEASQRELVRASSAFAEYLDKLAGITTRRRAS